MNTNYSLTSWSDTPPNLLMEISSFLPQHEMLKISSCICKKWKKLQEKADFWKRVFQASNSIFSKELNPQYYTYENFKLCASQIQRFKRLKLNISLNLRKDEFSGRNEKIYRTSNFLWSFGGIDRRGYAVSLTSDGEQSVSPVSEIVQPDIKTLLSEYGEIGFFSARAATGKIYYNHLVKIIRLSDLFEISTIDLRETISVEELSTDYLGLRDCKAAFVLDEDQLMIISTYAIITIWDIKDIFQPKFISKILLPKNNEQRFIEKIFKNDQYVMLVEKSVRIAELRGPWIRVFDLTKREVISEICIRDQNEELPLAYKISSNDQKTIIANSGYNIQAYRYDHSKKNFTKIWNRKREEHDNNFVLSSTHPFLFFTTKDSSSDIKGFTILNIQDGTEIFSITPPYVPCLPDADCNFQRFQRPLKACAYESQAYYKFMEDSVMRISKHQIDLWLIPSGYHQAIQLPLVHYMFESSALSDINAFMHKGSLILRYPKHINKTRFIKTILEIYEPQPQPQPQKTINTFSSLKKEEQTLVKSRKFFAKTALTNVFEGSAYLMRTVFQVIRFVSLFDFWNPRASSPSLKARVTKSKECLKQIIAIPLLVIGIEFGALYGIIDPYHGEKIIIFFSQLATSILNIH